MFDCRRGGVVTFVTFANLPTSVTKASASADEKICTRRVTLD